MQTHGHTGNYVRGTGRAWKGRTERCPECPWGVTGSNLPLVAMLERVLSGIGVIIDILLSEYWSVSIFVLSLNNASQLVILQ